MTGGGLALDLTLAALVAACIVLLARRRPAAAGAAAAAAADEAPAGYFARTARQAGFEPRRLRFFFWLARILGAVLLPLALLELRPAAGATPAVALAAVAVAGFLLPDAWLLLRRRARRRRIQAALSFFLDLLVALLYAGLTLEESLRRVAREGLAPAHPLARELNLLTLELDAGKDRSAAFRSLAERTGLPELRAVAAALRMSASHGVSIDSALATQAELLRTRRRESLRREVAAAATKAIAPVLLIGFPVFAVIVFFPALLELVETFRLLLR